MRKYLFNKYDLSSVILAQERKLAGEISNLNQNYLFNTTEDELIKYFVDKYTIPPIILYLEKVTIEQSEVNIDVSQDPSRAILDRSKPVYIKGNRIKYFVPYTGEKELFFCRPSTSSYILPTCEISDDEIIILVDTLEENPEKINEIYRRTIQNISQYISWVNNDISGFNNSLKSKVIALINSRKEKLNKNISMVNRLGFPLRKRNNIPQTYSVPKIKKKIIPKLPDVNQKNIPPEPVLGDESYESILKTITDMSLTMERSPKTFAKLTEEEIRDHFLMVLNSQFEGGATGETFNYEGKTDILIREKNKNIFICECKIWKGEKVLLGTIDQLLRYVSWRDTKTAIFLFNKNKDFTNVIKQIPDIVKKHPNYLKQINYSSDTGFRFLFHHRDDKGRELVLTVLLFNIPFIT
ncbi:hypothetical protein ACSSWA_10925 [Melioribacter sp. Ez-97]|uniref:hypothetical protein n=1 Tax=Melioribacter sp. Ez-97 TaxID=3423434 RepID=UPI003ED8DE41